MKFISFTGHLTTIDVNNFFWREKKIRKKNKSMFSLLFFISSSLNHKCKKNNEANKGDEKKNSDSGTFIMNLVTDLERKIKFL